MLAPPEEMLAIDDALGALADADPQAAELVKLRFYAGLTNARPLSPSASRARPPTTIGLTPGPGLRLADRAWRSPLE